VTAGLLNSTELYDPVLKTWTAGPNMFTLRAGHSAVLLADGRVLLSGGLSRDALGKPVTTTSCEIYDPRTNTMVRTASLPTAGTLGHRSTRLQDGTVLLCGGFSVNQNIATGLTEATAFVYDPTFAKWASVARMTQLRAFHGQALLPNGKVLVAGGVTSTGLNYVTVDSCELYDPGLKSWAPAGKLGTTRAFAQTLLLDTGQVVVIGGTSGNPSLNAVLTSTELFFSSLR
ncbi:MAG: Kelch repeat-containing protein, partial [Planctomycetota bacterium]